MITKNFTKWATCALFITTAALYSTNTEEPENAAVNSRPTSEEDRVAFFNQLEKENQLLEDEKPIEKLLACKKDNCPHLTKTKIKAACICRSRRPFSYHNEDGNILKTPHLTRKAVIMRDGSLWKVRESHAHKLHRWQKNDFIIITQNRDWCSSSNFPFIIVNHDMRESVEAYLSDGPLKQGDYTYHISTDPDGFRPNIGELDINAPDLNNLNYYKTTCWKLYEADYHVYKKWAPKDFIIIGINTGWGSDMTNILINVNTGSFARAKRL